MPNPAHSTQKSNLKMVAFKFYIMLGVTGSISTPSTLSYPGKFSSPAAKTVFEQVAETISLKKKSRKKSLFLAEPK